MRMMVSLYLMGEYIGSVGGEAVVEALAVDVAVRDADTGALTAQTRHAWDETTA